MSRTLKRELHTDIRLGPAMEFNLQVAETWTHLAR